MTARNWPEIVSRGRKLIVFCETSLFNYLEQ
jgi:hypothetical protein